jgi:hypothetical protein
MKDPDSSRVLLVGDGSANNVEEGSDYFQNINQNGEEHDYTISDENENENENEEKNRKNEHTKVGVLLDSHYLFLTPYKEFE